MCARLATGMPVGNAVMATLRRRDYAGFLRCPVTVVLCQLGISLVRPFSGPATSLREVRSFASPPRDGFAFFRPVGTIP